MFSCGSVGTVWVVGGHGMGTFVKLEPSVIIVRKQNVAGCRGVVNERRWPHL